MRFFLVRKSAVKFLSLLLILSLISAQSVRAVEIVVSENGTGSVSQAAVEFTTSITVQQSNTSDIDNSVDIFSNTGGNSVSDNTGDTTQISTGGSNTSVDVENSASTSQVESENCCLDQSSVTITGNGSGSENNIDLNQQTTTTTSINQSANIINSIQGYTDTGNNSANNNTGDVTIKTGDIKVTGGIINDPVNFVSLRVLGGNRNIEALITQNGTDSQNSINSNLTNNNNVFLNQEAYILNSVGWDLNTGGNSADGNNGDVDILTGNVSFDFFIKNFVNLGGVNITDCCHKEVPDDPGDGEEPKSEPPTGDGGGGNGNSGGGGGGSSGGVLLSEAASTGVGVIGLSDTSSEVAQALFFWIGLGMVIFGLKFIACEITSKKLAKRRLYL